MVRFGRALGFYAWRALALFFLARCFMVQAGAEPAHRQLLTLGDGQSHVCNCP